MIVVDTSRYLSSSLLRQNPVYSGVFQQRFETFADSLSPLFFVLREVLHLDVQPHGKPFMSKLALVLRIPGFLPVSSKKDHGNFGFWIYRPKCKIALSVQLVETDESGRATALWPPKVA
jgi:hypothetical protein